jgi:hypothetical protein
LIFIYKEIVSEAKNSDLQKCSQKEETKTSINIENSHKTIKKRLQSQIFKKVSEEFNSSRFA